MKKKLLANTITATIYQFIVLICGFILPRFILQTYGSEVNGLITSITQFIAVITYLDLGVGAVVKSNLYAPLAQGDMNLVSRIMVSSNRFFRKIAIILVVYIGILLVVYPRISEHDFSISYVCFLILILGLDSFAKYYFGITNQLLLTADQRGYLTYIIQSITLIVNLICAVILITLGKGIHAVKLSTAIIYLSRPLFYYFYVKKKYSINRKIVCKEEPIKQKWNGFAQHVAAIVLDGTDVIVLTLFSTLTNVSIYSVYCLVVNGIKQFIISFTNGITPLLGRLWGKKDFEKLGATFSWFEWIIHSVSTILYSCSFVLIVPFISVYTNSITDINYDAPIFSAVLVIAYLVRSLRTPYNSMILAAGHFKQTQNNYIFVVVINIVVSVAVVYSYGLVGVAIGTLLAIGIQTIWQANYVSKYLLIRSRLIFIKQLLVDGGIVLLSALTTKIFVFSNITYLSWIILGVKVFLVTLVISLGFNAIFYRDKMKFIGNIGRQKLSLIMRK